MSLVKWRVASIAEVRSDAGATAVDRVGIPRDRPCAVAKVSNVCAGEATGRRLASVGLCASKNNWNLNGSNFQRRPSQRRRRITTEMEGVESKLAAIQTCEQVRPTVGRVRRLPASRSRAGKVRGGLGCGHGRSNCEQMTHKPHVVGCGWATCISEQIRLHPILAALTWPVALERNVSTVHRFKIAFGMSREEKNLESCTTIICMWCKTDVC